ncbi:molybdenum cofactor biosynthesis protein MoaE, partial [Candidatus Bathyarchaeota archaeon]|nr:molybdenum cofactor biosynthesis protein MoaE [Candidatus Bathyarchaeota archaeon]
GYVGIHKKGEFSFSELLNSIKEDSNFSETGAIASFIRVVRGNTLDDKKVDGLELEAYEEQSNKVLGEICEDLKKKEGVIDVQIHHFVGKFSIGEDLVYVIVTGGHRKNVFEVLQEAVERYKSEVPIFKKEYVLNKTGKKESYWINEKKV